MKFCPHCGGDLTAHLAVATGVPAPRSALPGLPLVRQAPAPYDQTKIWKDLVVVAQDRVARSAPPTLAELVDPAVEQLLASADPTANVNGLSTVVHLVFDQSVTPRGGAVAAAVISEGMGAPSLERLKLDGYLVVDNKVVQVDGIPVSRSYGVLDYWGGEKQFKRWHLARPVEIDPSRNGNPFFMDENMIAFGAVWRDVAKIREAMMTLLSTFTLGVKEGEPIGYPFALQITQRT